jgi:hypothetical protein
MNRSLSNANRMNKHLPMSKMKATATIAITGALLSIAAHWLAGYKAAQWKQARMAHLQASPTAYPREPFPSPSQEVVPQPSSPSPPLEVAPQPSHQPGLPPERISADAAVNAASRMRRAARYGLSSDFAASWDSGVTAQAWRARLESCSYKHVWPYFFSGALLVAGPEPDSQIVAYYNPYADAALLTEWSRSSDGDRISNATVVLGSELDNAGQVSEADPPRWCKQDGPVFERLVQSLASFRQEYPSVSAHLLRKEGDSTSLGQNRSLHQLEQRCLALTVELTRLCATRSTEPSAARVTELLRSLASGTIDGLQIAGDNAKSDIQKLGSDRLARMRPVFATQFSDGCLVLLMDPREPTSLLAAHFSDTETLRLEGLHPKFFP